MNNLNKFALSFSQRLDLTYLLHVENIRKQYKNNKLKMLAPTWNDEFELADSFYSVSDIQDYIEYVIKI